MKRRILRHIVTRKAEKRIVLIIFDLETSLKKWTGCVEKEGKALQGDEKRGKLTVKNGWVTCPVCKRNRRLIRIESETVAKALPVFCRDCKSEIILDIDRGQSVERRSP